MDDHETLLGALISGLSAADPADVSQALQGLAASGIDVSQLTPEQVAELVHEPPDHHPDQVKFGWEGRYEPGTDSNGHKIIQSGTGPPTHANPAEGGDVSPNDVTY